ncbi:MAG: D-2-hydroxyacid dehydrogenase [Candidatus Merdivicinus sp.]|jgi:phosphoglycerate dehydrogenase-like enzyme
MESKVFAAVLFPTEEHHRIMLAQAAPEVEFYYGKLEDLPPERLEKVQVVLGNPSAAMLPRLTGMKLLQLNSAGVNGYFLAENALPPGAQLCNASGAYGVGIAEHMLGMTLALKKKLHRYRDAQMAGNWVDFGKVSAITGSRTLVVGLGDIGGEYGRRMAALGSIVAGIKRTPGTKPDWLSELGTLNNLKEMLAEADIVFVCLPDTPATRGLFSREMLGYMKQGAILLNAGRGTAIDTEALCDAVKSGALGGAGLDVTDPEPLPVGHRMWKIENILITPHVSGGFHLPYTHDRIVEICADNLRCLLDGQPFTHVVNRKEGY